MSHASTPPAQRRRSRPAGGGRVALLLPALDEEEALPLVLQEVPRDWVDWIVVVDNGSTDRTAEVARAGGAHVLREDRKGYGRACLTGLEALLGPDSPIVGEPALGAGDVIVFLDADHSDYPDDLPDIAGPVLQGEVDFIVGSRTLGGATMDALLPQAWFGNRLACFLMQVLFGARYSDLGPFRAIDVAALRHLDMRDEDFGWTVEMQLKARVARLAVREVPVRYRKRVGRSKITGTLSGTIRAGWKILSWIVGWRIRLLFGSRLARFERPAGRGSRA